MSSVARKIALQDGTPEIAERTRRHITRRLAPFLFLLYVLT